MATRAVSLAPSAGFCVKSVALNNVSCSISASSDGPAQPVAIPTGLKVFVNIAWDANVPPPPHGTDAAIERAVSSRSEISLDDAVDWFLPLVLSDPRSDKDKGVIIPTCRSSPLSHLPTHQPGSPPPCSMPSTTSLSSLALSARPSSKHTSPVRTDRYRTSLSAVYPYTHPHTPAISESLMRRHLTAHPQPSTFRVSSISLILRTLQSSLFSA